MRMRLFSMPTILTISALGSDANLGLTGNTVLACGATVAIFSVLFGLYQFMRLRKLTFHELLLKAYYIHRRHSETTNRRIKNKAQVY